MGQESKSHAGPSNSKPTQGSEESASVDAAAAASDYVENAAAKNDVEQSKFPIAIDLNSREEVWCDSSRCSIEMTSAVKGIAATP